MRAAIRQVLVQLQRTGAVGVADDVDAVLVELLEHRDQGIEGRVEAAGNIRRVAGEGDVARHDQLQVIAIALHLHARALQGLAQLGFLGVDVVAIAAACGTAHCGADQCAFGPVFAARSGRPDHGTGHGTDTAIDSGFTGFTLAGVGIGGTAGQEGNARCCECQIAPFSHVYSFIFSCWDRSLSGFSNLDRALSSSPA
ncbi:hypothetical protein D3C85_516530 [compost metagenome]